MGRGFGGELECSGERGEGRGSCTCTNVQAKSTLFSILAVGTVSFFSYYIDMLRFKIFLLHCSKIR